ncbi:hypothetical protein DESC_140024 [Desulfosarcina cetonica]|nr:hypothetical protein DESC_140024 [Desulfosarcina cetonica]
MIAWQAANGLLTIGRRFTVAEKPAFKPTNTQCATPWPRLIALLFGSIHASDLGVYYNFRCSVMEKH